MSAGFVYFINNALVTKSSVTDQGASRLRLENFWINIAEMITMCVVKCVESVKMWHMLLKLVILKLCNLLF